jgi:hypothetical protein
MWYLQESLRMQRSLHGDGDHPGIAVTLHKLGDVLAQTGDLKQAMRYLQESSQMAARRRFKIYGLILSQYHSLLESFE